jgi:hypothetical protein
MIEAFVESWKRVSFGNETFLLYKIELKRSEPHLKWHIERRYSEFYELHGKVKKIIERDVKYFTLLEDAFPSKQIFSLQTDSFAEKRARSLDSYIQILIAMMETNRSQSEEFSRILQVFFEIKDAIGNPRFSSESSKPSPAKLQTPCIVLIREIDSLRLISFSDSDFEKRLRALQDEIVQLQDKRNPSLEEAKCVRTFYDIKREWELSQIKAGNELDGWSFNSGREVEKNTKLNHIDSCPSVSADLITAMISDSHTNTKALLRGQEAILEDLSNTVVEQRKLSQEIYREIAEQSKLVDRIDRQQEVTREDFKGSTGRVKKLQK